MMTYHPHPHLLSRLRRGGGGTPDRGERWKAGRQALWPTKTLPNPSVSLHQNPTPLLPSARPQRSPAQGSTQPRQRAGLATPRLLRFRSAASRAALTPAACLPGPLRRSPTEPATFFPERTWRSLASLESGTRDFLYPFLHFPCVIKINFLRWHVIVPS
ncbi:hypothetical protein ZWY2020_031807 [Hordeum vulgare]|nr:hypothetical protein ZWY2020_031807 [Hordeum vulgare]